MPFIYGSVLSIVGSVCIMLCLCMFVYVNVCMCSDLCFTVRQRD